MLMTALLLFCVQRQMDWNGFNFKGVLLSQSKARALTAGAARAKKKERKMSCKWCFCSWITAITKLLIVLLHLVFLQQRARDTGLRTPRLYDYTSLLNRQYGTVNQKMKKIIYSLSCVANFRGTNKWDMKMAIKQSIYLSAAYIVLPV